MEKVAHSWRHSGLAKGCWGRFCCWVCGWFSSDPTQSKPNTHPGEQLWAQGQMNHEPTQRLPLAAESQTPTCLVFSVSHAFLASVVLYQHPLPMQPLKGKPNDKTAMIVEGPTLRRKIHHHRWNSSIFRHQNYILPGDPCTTHFAGFFGASEVTWTACITACSQGQNAEAALALFDQCESGNIVAASACLPRMP